MPNPPDSVAEPQAAYQASPNAARATYQDVLDAPPHMTAEILDGELYLGPRPASPHARCSSVLGGDLVGAFDRKAAGDGDGSRPGGWWVLDKPELHLGRQILVPDVVGWRRERMPVFPSTAYFDLRPDWVCEVLSPSTRRNDRILKTRIYAEHEVPWLWLVDPLARTLEVLELRDGYWSFV